MYIALRQKSTKYINIDGLLHLSCGFLRPACYVVKIVIYISKWKKCKQGIQT